MPIRAESRDRYPKDWPAISARIRQLADNRCEQCGVRNYALGGRDERGNFCEAWPLGETSHGLEWPKPGDWAICQGGGRYRIIRIVLTVAHLDHTPEHCDDDNLMALCQRCHNRLDAAMRRRGVQERQHAKCAVGDLFHKTGASNV